MSCTRIIKACFHVHTCRPLILGLFRLLKVNPTFAEYKQGFKQGFEQDNVGVQQHYPVSEIIYHHPSMSSNWGRSRFGLGALIRNCLWNRRLYYCIVVTLFIAASGAHVVFRKKCSADLLSVRVLDDSGSSCYHSVSVVDFCYEDIVRIIWWTTCTVLPQHIRPPISVIDEMTFPTEVDPW